MADYLQSISPNTYMTLSLIVFSVTLLLRSRHYFKKSKVRTEFSGDEAAAVRVPAGQPPRVLTVRSEGRGVPQRVVKSPETPKPFAGSTVPSEVSRWEVEIHELGRQTIAQIDTKLVALQTLATEVNQVGQRVELMIEHLEGLLNAARSTAPPAVPEKTSSAQTQNFQGLSENTSLNSSPASVTSSEKETPRVLSAASLPESSLLPLNNLLEEFEREKQAWELAETEATGKMAAMGNTGETAGAGGRPTSATLPELTTSRARILEPHPTTREEFSQSRTLREAPPEIEKDLALPHIALLDESAEDAAESRFSRATLTDFDQRPSRLARRVFAEDTTPQPVTTTPQPESPSAGPTMSYSRSSIYDTPAPATTTPFAPSVSVPQTPQTAHAAPAASTAAQRPPLTLSASMPFPHPQPAGHQVPPASPDLLRFSATGRLRRDFDATPTGGLPGTQAGQNPTEGSPEPPSRDGAPQFSSLFERERQKPVIAAGTFTPAVPAQQESVSPMLVGREENLDLRQQIFLLSDYGYKAKEIAAQLSRPVGEIEFVLNLRQTPAPSKKAST